MQVPEYFVFDLETNDLLPKHVHATQFGWCHVIDGEVADCDSFFIKLPPDCNMSQGAFGVHGKSAEWLRQEGLCPELASQEIVKVFNRLIEAKVPLVGHNIFHFDIPVLVHGFKEYDLPTPKFSQTRLFDTGLIWKAREMNWFVKTGESYPAFGKRVHKGSRKGRRTKWSLDHCLQQLNVTAPRGDDKHDAAFDCRLTHLLFDKFCESGILEEVRWV